MSGQGKACGLLRLQVNSRRKPYEVCMQVSQTDRFRHPLDDGHSLAVEDDWVDRRKLACRDRRAQAASPTALALRVAEFCAAGADLQRRQQAEWRGDGRF